MHAVLSRAPPVAKRFVLGTREKGSITSLIDWLCDYGDYVLREKWRPVAELLSVLKVYFECLSSWISMFMCVSRDFWGDTTRWNSVMVYGGMGSPLSDMGEAKFAAIHVALRHLIKYSRGDRLQVLHIWPRRFPVLGNRLVSLQRLAYALSSVNLTDESA